jgi:3-methyl-2-oxobutanoate hydroxymethyltransferase
MQAERIAGFREFIDDVQAGGFPGPEHVIDAPENLISAFVDLADADE